MIKPQFNYSENPGGGIGFLYTRQREMLGNAVSFKIWNDSSFINLNYDAMTQLVMSLLEETKSELKSLLPTALQTELEVIRQDVEYNTTCMTIKAWDIEVIRFCFYLENDGYDYESELLSSANTSEVNVFNLVITGVEAGVDLLVKRFREKRESMVKAHKNALVRWYVPAQHGGLKDFNFQLKKDWTIHPEVYPWVKTSLENYYRSFKESRAQIMVLYGEPGTGKTSFIRDMICELNLNSIISYDLKVITSDMTFVKYLSDKNFDAIIIEDADELLTAARGDYNKIISKILNVSDGLIKLPRKKLILTTNLDKLTDLDPAIIRPGRCFDVMEFRGYDQDEALVVAGLLDVELSQELRNKKSVTLAEIYALKELSESSDPMTTSHQIKKRAFGFV